MRYFIRSLSLQGNMSTQVWKIDDRTAIRVGVSNAEHSAGSFFKADPGECIWAALRRQTPWFEGSDESPFHKCLLRPGEYYPRMARPLDQHPAEIATWSRDANAVAGVRAIARGQLTALMRQLDRICQTIHPVEQNLGAFGHDIRNLLILACTEVESHWRGVLVANNVRKRTLTRKDYVALRAPMRLDEFAVSFPNYPWLSPFRPFEKWGSSETGTADLAWYDAYNAVKHDRESEFERATLHSVFEAISACVVMMVAQFGSIGGLGHQSELTSFFQLTSWPQWPLEEVYIYPYGETAPAGWVPMFYDFSSRAPIDNAQK